MEDTKHAGGTGIFKDCFVDDRKLNEILDVMSNRPKPGGTDMENITKVPKYVKYDK